MAPRCLICGTDPLRVYPTEYEGLFRCTTCGIVYDEEISLIKPNWFPLFYGYYHDTGMPIPMISGCITNPFTREEIGNWYRWLSQRPGWLKKRLADIPWSRIDDLARDYEW